MRQWTVFVAAAAVATACSSAPPPASTVEPPTPTTTLPAPTTTMAVTATTLASADGTRFERVDPVTLEPVDGYASVPVGGWFVHAVSPGGRWLAFVTFPYAGQAGELRLVDVERWEIASAGERIVNLSSLLVDDDGTIAWVEGIGTSRPALNRKALGGAVEEVALLPEAFVGYDAHRYSSGIALFGLVETVLRQYQGSAALMTVDAAGMVREVPLPAVTMGQTSFTEEPGIGPVFDSVNPDVVWDGDRALIVHADESIVTEVDLIAGTVESHVIGPEISAFGRFLQWLIPPAHAKLASGDTVTAVLSPDGSRLYKAASRSDVFEDAGGTWHNVITPLGIEVVDTANWTPITALELPVDSVALSPDGRVLLAVGSSVDWAEGSEWVDTVSPLYVIDAANLEVLHEVEVGVYPTIGFPTTAGFAYLTTYGDSVTAQVLDLATGELGASRNAAVLTPIPTIGVLGVEDLQLPYATP